MVRLIAVVLVGTGIWMVTGLWSSYAHIGLALDSAASSAGAGVAILLFAQLLTPILKVLAGVGLLARNRWGWTVALFALTADVIALGVSVLRLHRFEAVSPSLHAEMTHGGSAVRTISAVPIYAILFLSLVCIVLMSTRAARREWRAA